MTVVWVLLTVYVVSALACAAIKWADYKDRATYFEQRHKEKVIQLFIVPLFPIINTLTVAQEMFDNTGD